MKGKVNSGHTITHSHTAAVVAGEPIDLGGLVGVAVGAYAANESGEYEISGVKEFKSDANAKAFMATVDWSVSGAEVVAGGAGDFELGKVTEAAAPSGIVDVMVNTQPGPGPSYS